MEFVLFVGYKKYFIHLRAYKNNMENGGMEMETLSLIAYDTKLVCYQ